MLDEVNVIFACLILDHCVDVIFLLSIFKDKNWMVPTSCVNITFTIQLDILNKYNICW
jgi:hypothetical protein